MRSSSIIRYKRAPVKRVMKRGVKRKAPARRARASKATRYVTNTSSDSMDWDYSRAQPPRARGRGNYTIEHVPGRGINKQPGLTTAIRGMPKTGSKMQTVVNRISKPYRMQHGDPGAVMPERAKRGKTYWEGVVKRWNNFEDKKNHAVNEAVKGVGYVIGDALGGGTGVGGLIGQTLANQAHRVFRSVSGYGDYTVKSNSIYNSSTQTPLFSPNNRKTRIRFREYITDIYSGTLSGGATGFNIQKFVINPGLIETFPWLGNIALNYEEYKLRGMIFEFKSTSGNALTGTNTALGTVIMATSYNVQNADFASKQQMENYEFSTSARPSQSFLHAIECKPGESPLPEMFIRSNGTVINSSADLRLYDFGNFYIATQGVQGAQTNLGELWVTYDIELLKPKLTNISTQIGCHYKLSANRSHTASVYFCDNTSDLPSQTSTSNFPACKITNPNKITFDPSFTGDIKLSIAWTGSSTPVATWPTVTPGGVGVSALNLAANNTSHSWHIASGTTSTVLGYQFWRIVKGGTLTLSGGTLPSAGTSGDVYVNVIPFSD